ncbi:MAG TPA: amino acid ABC transporter permease, partial [Reyranella sp.]|nr:amino acid ABC transporter permease [Reyranella sp.]
MSDIQAQADLSFVRQEIAASEPPPRSMVGPVGWVRRNLFASVGDTILTILAILFIAWALPKLLGWAFFRAAWDGPDRSVCVSPEVGACWAFVKAKFAQFIYGRYPIPERWRVDLVFLLGAAGLIPLAIPSIPYKGWNALYLFVVFPVLAFFLLVGGVFGLREVETALWGGLLVTLVVSYVGIVASLPLG